MERRLLWFFLVSLEIALLQSTCAIHFRIKPKRKRVRKCRGGRRKVRKINVLTILRYQNLYGGQIGCNPGNLIEINIINNLSSKSACTEFFTLVSSTPGPLVRMRTNRNKGICHRSGS